MHKIISKMNFDFGEWRRNKKTYQMNEKKSFLNIFME